MMGRLQVSPAKLRSSCSVSSSAGQHLLGQPIARMGASPERTASASSEYSAAEVVKVAGLPAQGFRFTDCDGFAPPALPLLCRRFQGQLPPPLAEGDAQDAPHPIGKLQAPALYVRARRPGLGLGWQAHGVPDLGRLRPPTCEVVVALLVCGQLDLIATACKETPYHEYEWTCPRREAREAGWRTDVAYVGP